MRGRLERSDGGRNNHSLRGRRYCVDELHIGRCCNRLSEPQRSVCAGYPNRAANHFAAAVRSGGRTTRVRARCPMPPCRKSWADTALSDVARHTHVVRLQSPVRANCLRQDFRCPIGRRRANL